MRRDSLMQEKMKHAEEEAAAKAAAEQAAVAASRRKAYLASQERRRQYLESAAEPQLGPSRSLRSTTSSTSLPCISQVLSRTFFMLPVHINSLAIAMSAACMTASPREGLLRQCCERPGKAI